MLIRLLKNYNNNHNLLLNKNNLLINNTKRYGSSLSKNRYLEVKIKDIIIFFSSLILKSNILLL